MKFLRLFIKLSVIVIMLLTILFVASKLLEQKIVDKAINILNNKLDVPIYVDDISFTLIKKFPNATLQLNSVTILSAKDFNRSHFEESSVDTLAHIGELFLSVNLPALMNNSLNITKAYIQNGYINILVDKKGRGNYSIFSNQQQVLKGDTTSNDFEFLLSKIHIKSVQVNFINRYKNSSVSVYAPDYTIDGNFYKSEYSANTKGKLLLNYFEQGNIKIHPKLPVKIDMNLGISNNKISIISGNLKSKDYNLTSSGTIDFGTPLNLSLKVTGSSSNLDKLTGFLKIKKLNSFTTKGQLGVSAIIKGGMSTKVSPHIIANFRLINGSVINKSGVTIIDALEFDGTYSNGANHRLNSSSIKFNNALLVTGESSVNTQVSVVNFINPSINISGNTSLQLEDLKKFNTDITQFIIDGQVVGKFDFSGNVDTKLPLSISQFKDWNKTVKLNITDAQFGWKEQGLSIKQANGKLNIKNNSISINTLSGNIQNSNIKGDISLNNFFIPLADSTQPFKIRANLNADIIDYNNYKHIFINEGSGKPKRKIILEADINANKLVFNKLVANKATGHIYYNKDGLQVTNFRTNTMGGSIFSNINYLKKNQGRVAFQTSTTTKDIDIKALFTTFNNFGQTFITSSHIGGLLTTDFALEMDFFNGKLKASSIEFLGHSKIENGRLKYFKPIKDASRFSNNEDMSNLEFTTLETDLLISGGVINIPKVKIASNAFDITLSGLHKFNGDYEYHMRINMLDFIGSKSKRLEKQQTEFGYIEDDGLGETTLYLLAESKDGKSNVKLDSDEIKKSLQKSAKQEKKEFKKVLHDEFGWFKKDTTLDYIEDTDKPDFIIEWDEE